MTRIAEEYRLFARECLDAARSTPLGEMRTTLIDVAQTWLQLAEEQEHEGSNIGSPVEERPVVQQQQQTQPKDEDKKE